MTRRLGCIALLASAWLWSATARAQREVVLWHSYRAGEAQALDEIVAAFRARAPEVPVRVLQVPFGAYDQKLRAAIPQGNGPDLFIASNDNLRDFIERRLITEPPAIEAERFEPRLVETLTVDGRLWGYPMAFKSLVLFYRKDLVPEPPADTAALVAAARAATGDGRYGLVFEMGSFYFHAPWFFGFGAELLSRDGQLLPLDTGAVAASGEFLRSLVFEARVTPADVNGALVTELFNTGRAAMVVNGPWFVPEIAEGVPWAVAPLPTVSETGLPARPFVTTEGLFVTPLGQGRPEVMALAQAITDDEAARLRARRGRQPVANARVLAELGDDALLATMRAQLPRTVSMPTAPVMQVAWEPLAQALRQVSRGAQSPRAAFIAAGERIALLSRPLPERASSTPYVLVGLALLAVGLYLAARRVTAELVGRVAQAREAYVFIAPAALGMALLVGVPFLAGVGLGFFEVLPSGALRFVGLANFANILAARDYAPTEPKSFYFALAVTVLWTAANVALHVLVGFAFALMLEPKWLRGRGVFRVLLILPWAVPSYITALVFKGLFNQQLGAVNALLSRLGVAPVGWFDSFWPAFAANLTTNVWLGFPFMMVTVLGALQAIPQDLYEAARVDGAGAWRRFVHVTLPLVGPALVPAVVLGTIWTFNMFNVVFLVSEGQPEGATDILVTEAYRWAFARNGRYGYAAAYSLVIFVILLAYSALTKRLVRSRLEAGT